MQTILGSGGSIGTDLARELIKFTDKIRLVSRNPKKVNQTDELFPADLLNEEKVLKAVQGSEIVYLVAGLPYKTKVWEEMWPTVMRNTINACITHKANVVFLDNLYAYDPSYIPHTTEATPMNPTSRKGKVREQLVRMLMDEVDNGTLNALIARAPDFYGPGISNGVLNEAVLKPLKEGKKASWFCSVDKVHSFIWTPDAAKATAILGNDKTAYGAVWHLPTAKDPLTGKQFIEAIARELNVKARYQVAGKVLVKILGVFNPMMKEFSEMLYQFDQEYVFDSSKFEKHYKFKPTSYPEGIRKMVDHVA